MYSYLVLIMYQIPLHCRYYIKEHSFISFIKFVVGSLNETHLLKRKLLLRNKNIIHSSKIITCKTLQSPEQPQKLFVSKRYITFYYLVIMKLHFCFAFTNIRRQPYKNHYALRKSFSAVQEILLFKWVRARKIIEINHDIHN